MIAREEPRTAHQDLFGMSKPRLPARACVIYHPEPHGRHNSEYLLDLAESVGLGCLFLATDQPLPPGTILALRIEGTEAEDDVLLHGRAVVRWRRRWGRPRGMQVELFELTGAHSSEPFLSSTEFRGSVPPMLS